MNKSMGNVNAKVVLLENNVKLIKSQLPGFKSLDESRLE